ncbi:HpcH/HpaI aldolase/citrate lyase family protein [Ideonella sp. YS5]|uniref:HpcH/HpaI aldolase/citrate lyase family protein n=1 Tax=Ideonella sp. YS5 TaxID=3453714 RepID=UPI003EEBAAB0
MPTAHHATLAEARSLLFVPGHRPERFAKALASGADAVVVDLEDAVPAELKSAARQAILASWSGLRSAGVPVVIRVNGPSTAFGREDLAALAALAPTPVAVMVPKAESAVDLEAVRQALPGAALLPLVESAGGLEALRDIAGSEGVLRLVVGHIDFMADTGLRCSPDERELDPLRFAVAMQTRLYRLASAIDGVTTSIGDEERLCTDARRALNFGFGAKLCIHPAQVAGVHEALAPTAVEIDWARRVVAADEAAGGAAVQLDGRMVDAPVVLQARRVLRVASRPAPSRNASSAAGNEG